MMLSVNDGHGNYIVMETGGAHNDTGGVGQYASPNGPATATDDPEWTDIWYLPGPIAGGGDLTAQDSANIVTILNAVTGSQVSGSPFRQLGEGPVWQQHQLVWNDDALEHPQAVEWFALHGDTQAMALLETIAAANPLQYPDRAPDITLAQTVLARVKAGGQTPTPVNPTPVTPTPTPTPAPSTGGTTITTAQLAQWGKDAITILGAIGTWATAAHNLLGQYLTGASATVIPGALALGTAGLVGHTVSQKRTAQKQLVKMKAGQR
jgi:hypothetical protein